MTENDRKRSPRPDIVLKRKRLSKTKTVIIFRRNNLSFADFHRTDEGFVFQEAFKHHEITGSIRLEVNSDNLYDIFSVDTKTAKIRGGKNHLGIFLRFSNQKLPLTKSVNIGCANFELNCDGKFLHLDRGKKHNSLEWDYMVRGGNSNNVAAPKTASWGASHPFQGGGCSPR